MKKLEAAMVARIEEMRRDKDPRLEKALWCWAELWRLFADELKHETKH